jgi:hypothetical protein
MKKLNLAPRLMAILEQFRGSGGYSTYVENLFRPIYGALFE